MDLGRFLSIFGVDLKYILVTGGCGRIARRRVAIGSKPDWELVTMMRPTSVGLSGRLKIATNLDRGKFFRHKNGFWKNILVIGNPGQYAQRHVAMVFKPEQNLVWMIQETLVGLSGRLKIATNLDQGEFYMYEIAFQINISAIGDPGQGARRRAAMVFEPEVNLVWMTQGTLVAY